VRCNGVELHVERRGRGPKLLFCNGSGTTVATSEGLLNHWAESFELVCFDYRGMGASAPVSQPYGMADVAADVLALLDQLDWQRVAVAGWSFGGMVAQELAVTWPERVERLALLSTSPGGGVPSFRLDTLAGLAPAERSARMLQLMDTRWSPEWLTAHPGEATVAAQCGTEAPAGEGEAQARGRQLQLLARRGHDVLERLGRITCPTLVANGRFDGIAPLANGQAIVDRVRQATLRPFDGGHAFFLQDPLAWPELTAFLAGRDHPAAADVPQT
jgi:pimeloyl-ACP methyl ester carboxylesterase